MRALDKETRLQYYTRVHKKMTLVYSQRSMKQKWIAARSDFEQDNEHLLAKPLHKNEEDCILYESWLDEQVEHKGKQSIVYFTKGELKDRGWTQRLIDMFSLTPQKKVYLGRGRYVYYYELEKLLSIEETEEFLLAKQKKRRKKGDLSQSTHGINPPKKLSLSDYNLL